MNRRRMAIGAALPLAALGVVVAVVVSGGDGSGNGAEAATGTRMGSAQVERRTLVEREEVDGTIGYDDPQPAVDRLGGTLTWLPRAGATIRPGQRLFAVDGEPVLLMDGDVPAWRTLKEGVEDGEDVRQLERNLAALGYDPGSVDDDFTSSTAAAVERWQDAWGLEETGEVELGRVVFLPGPRRIAEVEATLGATGGGGTGSVAWDGGDGLQTMAIADTSGGGAPASTATTPSSTAPSSTTPSTGTGTTTTPGATTPGTTTPDATTPRDPAPDDRSRADDRQDGSRSPSGGDRSQGGDRGGGSGDGGSGSTGEGGRRPSGSGTSSGGGTTGTPGAASGGTGGGTGGTPSGGSGGNSGNGGDSGDAGGGGGGTEVLSTTSTRRVVTAELDAADQGLARVGGRATVVLPDGKPLQGRIVEIGAVTGGGSDDSGGGGAGGDDSSDPTLPLTIELNSDRGLGKLDEAPVSVELAATTRRGVLAVPVAALVARDGGGYAVRVIGAVGATREVPVEPGMFADGWVELVSDTVRAGDRVQVPR